MVEDGGLVMAGASETPEEEGDALGQLLLIPSLGGLAFNDLALKLFPVLDGLQALDDDGVWGHDAVLEGVAAGDGLALVAGGASAARINHASAPGRTAVRPYTSLRPGVRFAKTPVFCLCPCSFVQNG